MSFDVLFEFEEELGKYTGAPYVVATDGCTHAIELCMRYHTVTSTSFTAYTYLSIPQLMDQLEIKYTLLDEQWTGEYQFHATNIWDSARRLERNMYRTKQKQCLSFGNGKPLQIGKVGAILLDDKHEYEVLSRWRSDGRDLRQPGWANQELTIGYHYCPTLEDCKRGLEKLAQVDERPKYISYPDCRNLTIE